MSSDHVVKHVARTYYLSSRSVAQLPEPDTKSDELVEIDLGDGLAIYTAGGDELDAQIEGGSARGATSGTVRLISKAPKQRGLADIAIKALRVIDVDVDGWLGIDTLKDRLAGTIAAETARRVDDRKIPQRPLGLGLYRCDRHQPYLEHEPTLQADRSMLLLLHGFCSNTAGAFDGFWQPAGRATLDALIKHYDEQVCCFDHATLGVSPVENALAVAKELPDNINVHLLAHSRGGLIGEILSRAQPGQQGITHHELERFESAGDRNRDSAMLRELIRVMADKHLRVDRFVRVGSPMRGTWLASNRLDRWLSILYNVAKLAIPAGPQLIADQVFDILAVTIKKRLSRSGFPGIEAMRPDGPFMALLNDAPPEVRQRLTVIGGDCVGTGIFHRLKILITDGFFGEPHDLVVPSASMFGGAPRTGEVRYFFHQTARVDHFHYFRHAESLQRIQAGLIGSDKEWQTLQKMPAIGETLDLTPNRAIRADAPINVMLPGIMGSALAYRQDDRLWIDFGDIAFGRFANLRLKEGMYESPYSGPGSADVYPLRPLDFWPVNFYGDLMQALAQRGEIVLPAAYDWRKPLRIAADDLASKLKQAWPEDSPRPVRLIAHSMGGLVARIMFHRHPALRQRFEKSDRNRLLMLGTPNAGSLAVARTLLGDNELLDKLDCLAPQDERTLLSIASSFPGFHELLPNDEPNWSSPSKWERLFSLRGHNRAPTIDARAMEVGEQGRQLLRAALQSLPHKQTVYVAGFVDAEAPDATISGIDPSGRYERGPGDGAVTYASGLIDGIPTWYANATHGDLPACKSAFPAYFELLERGYTSLLPRDYRNFRESRRGVQLQSFDRKELPYRPSRGDLYRAIFGASPVSAFDLEPSAVDPIVLRVVNAGLRFARYQLLVGHYQGDMMGGSEADVDRLFDGQLRTALDLGVYPSDIQSFQIFKRKKDAPDKRSPFAIVVGLAQPGELSVGDLRKTVRRGILGWFGTATSALSEEYSEYRRRAFSIVLLGSSVSGMSVAECTRAILQGVQDAQGVLLERLRSADGNNIARTITEIELVEMYEDKALELTHALPRLLQDEELRDSFKLEKGLEMRDDAVRRLRGEARASSARRLDIRAFGSRLHYSLPGIQAAVPVMKRIIDQAEIQTYAREVDARLSTDPTLGRVLFNQLLPLDLKNFALEQYDLLLTLNQSASSIPWELTDSGSKLPLAVQSGMIRQLRSARYKARERVGTDTALVVGEPEVSGLPELSGARREAAVVAEVLRAAGFEVTHLDRPSTLEVRDELSKRPYRIIHFAGHGVVDYRSPLSDPNLSRTGMVIGSLKVDPKQIPDRAREAVMAVPRGMADERDAGSFETNPAYHWVLLTPDDIEECVAQVPEFVFINCCHLGRQSGIASNAPKMASSFANSFMDIGCRAVIAAGWAVEDRAAQAFAERFYSALVKNGECYIEAVRQARKATHKQYGKITPTWGAYQCYGDPSYTAVRLPHTDEVPTFGIRRELEHWLRDRAIEAMGADSAQAEAIRGRINTAIAHAKPGWLADESLLLAALAAYESVAAYEEALELIENRIASRASISPQMRSLRTRMILRLASAAIGTTDEARTKAEAEAAMDALKEAASHDNGSCGWWSYSTCCRRWFLLQDEEEDKVRVLSELARASAKAWNMTIKGIMAPGDARLRKEGIQETKQERQRRSDEAIDETTDAQAQKALAAVIVEIGRKGLEKAGRTTRRSLREHHDLLISQCESKVKRSTGSTEFWDDVDNADLKLLLLASPLRARKRGKTRTHQGYNADAETIASLYRGAILISGTAGQRESIGSLVKFWCELAKYLADASPTAAQRDHWASFRAALIQAQVPGCEERAPA